MKKVFRKKGLLGLLLESMLSFLCWRKPKERDDNSFKGKNYVEKNEMANFARKTSIITDSDRREKRNPAKLVKAKNLPAHYVRYCKSRTIGKESVHNTKNKERREINRRHLQVNHIQCGLNRTHIKKIREQSVSYKKHKR